MKVVGIMNNYLFTQMRKLTLLHCGNAKEIALQCFNNAYYICTLVQLDEFPDLSMDKYEKKLLEVEIPFPEDVYQASMALVCILLAAYDNKYKQKDDLLINSIHHWTSSNKWTSSYSRKSFDDIIKTCNTNRYILPKSEFAPRDIIDVIETFNESYLQVYAEYICERLSLLEGPRQRMHGADMVIARIKDYQRELCKDTGYNPKKDCFKYAENDPYIKDLDFENQIRKNYAQSEKAIEYYKEHYPKEVGNHPEQKVDDVPTIPGNEALIAENEQLKQQLTQRVSENNELGAENAQQETRIHMLETENVGLKKQLEQRDEQIKELAADLQEANATSVEYDSTGSESVNYRYVLGKGKHIMLTDRERNIIEYVIHCVATQKANLNANMKRLIGVEKTVGAHFNDSKKGASRPLANEEKKNIKLVLDGIGVDYAELLAEHL